MRKSIIAILIITVLAYCMPAMAWSYETVDWTQVEVAVEDSKANPSPWAADEISEAEDYGLIPEMTDYIGFQYDITREQFAELVVCLMEKALGKELETGSASFSDCNNPQVLKACNAGVVNGTGDGSFAPKNTTNREQIAAMLYRAIKYIEQTEGISIITIPANIASFEDADAVSGWAVEGMGALAANGLMKGTSDTTLAPLQSCTVEQSVILAKRIFEKF